MVTRKMKKNNLQQFCILIATVIFCLFFTYSVYAEIVVKNGQKIAFLGNSITEDGYLNPAGYVNLTISGLKNNGVLVTAIPAGISGHKSNQMLGRLKDVLDKKPDWLVLSCGVNDVWHGSKGVPLNEYKANITAIIDQCQKENVKVLILTTTVIGEDLNNENNLKLASYNQFLRMVSKEKGCRLADLNKMFQNRLARSDKPGNQLTTDGVHMNSEGYKLMAEGLLSEFGLNKAQIKKAEECWLSLD